MISFQPSPEERELRQLAREFAQSRLRPHARAAEQAGRPPEALAQESRELGLGGVALPEGWGGAGFSQVAACLVEEELAWGDPGLAVALGLREAALAFVADLLGEAPAGGPWEGPGVLLWPQVPDDPLAGSGITWTTQLQAAPKGERLSGSIGAAPGAQEAAWFLIPAARGERVVLLRLEGTAPGVERRPLRRPLGLAAAGWAEVALDGIAVGPGAVVWEGTVRDPAWVRARERARLRVAAQLVGTARAALEYATQYAAQRQAFGQPIAQFQGISFMVAEMAMAVEAARNLVWYGAWRLDRGALPAGGAQALLHARGAALEVADRAVQVLGGHGYMADHPVEKWLRDARALGVAVWPETALEVEAASELGLAPGWVAGGAAGPGPVEGGAA